MSNICPVCGFSKLEEPPYDELGYPTYVICPCCGYEFGFDDSSKGLTFDEYLNTWIEKGYEFFDKDLQPPNWNFDQLILQLENRKNVNFRPRL